jgi:hypothetical protein
MIARQLIAHVEVANSNVDRPAHAHWSPFQPQLTVAAVHAAWVRSFPNLLM